jgi:hypothetical protein
MVLEAPRRAQEAQSHDQIRSSCVALPELTPLELSSVGRVKNGRAL